MDPECTRALRALPDQCQSQLICCIYGTGPTSPPLTPKLSTAIAPAAIMCAGEAHGHTHTVARAVAAVAAIGRSLTNMRTYGRTGGGHRSLSKQIHIKWHFRGPTATTRTLARTLAARTHARAHIDHNISHFNRGCRSCGACAATHTAATHTPTHAHTRSTYDWMPVGMVDASGSAHAIAFLNAVKFDTPVVRRRRPVGRTGRMRYVRACAGMRHILWTECKFWWSRLKLTRNECAR